MAVQSPAYKQMRAGCWRAKDPHTDARAPTRLPKFRRSFTGQARDAVHGQRRLYQSFSRRAEAVRRRDRLGHRIDEGVFPTNTREKHPLIHTAGDRGIRTAEVMFSTLPVRISRQVRFYNREASSSRPPPPTTQEPAGNSHHTPAEISVIRADAVSGASQRRLKRRTAVRMHRTCESSHSVRGSDASHGAGSHREGPHRYGARDWRPMSCAG